MNRVVVTGMGGVTSVGCDWSSIERNLRRKQAGVVYVPEWDRCVGMRTRLAGPVAGFAAPVEWERKKTRSMGRVALLAAKATESALHDSGLLGNPLLQSGEAGIAYGSSTGSPTALVHFVPLLLEDTMKGISATSYLQMMPHTCAANLSIFYGMCGRIIPTCSACTSGSQAVGLAYETIKHGYQKLMAAGGAEELCVTIVGVFDSMYAASVRNDSPQEACRPFDRERDGLVIGEGAGTLILEELTHALNRGAKIYAEVVGFGTNSDGLHITNPTAERMAKAMELALEDANLKPSAIGYINAHAAGTKSGDAAESHATAAVFGTGLPVSSIKGYVGHTLGASGALEAWLSIEMMRTNWFAPTLNLEQVDESCAPLSYIMGDGLKLCTEYVMSNNFAFGGTNTSLIFKRWS